MRQSVAGFLAAVALGFVIAPSLGEAYVRRYHGAICMPASSSQSYSYNETFGMLNGGGGTGLYYCPIQSDDSQAHQLVWQANVHGQKLNGVGTDSITACTKYWAATGYFCGYTTTTSAAGTWGLGAWLDGWTSGADFPYIKVFLQPSSSIYGIFLVS